MARQSVAYRLVSYGKDQLINDFRDIGEGGDASAKKIARAFERDMQNAEKALAKLEDRAAKLEMARPNAAGATNRNNPIFGSSADFGAGAGSAQKAASALFAEQDRLIQQRNVILAQINPLFAAEMQYNAAIERATDLRRRAILTEEEFISVQRAAKGALDEATRAHGGATGASNAMRAGMQQAGFQVQDFVVQVAGGTSATRAFSQQAPQMIGSLQLMAAGAENGKGKFAQFANVISGPWGVALGIAIPVAGMLAEKLLDDADASEEAKKAAEDHKKAIDAVIDAMEQSVQTAEDKARATALMTLNERQSAIATEEKAQALLREAKAELELRKARSTQGGQRSEIAALGLADDMARVAMLEADLKTSQDRVKELTGAANIAVGQLQATIIDQMMDPRGRVNREYDRQRNEAIAGGKGAAAIVAIERARDAELKKIDDTNKALREAERLRGAAPKRDGADATPAQVSKLLTEAFGGTITSTTGGKHVDGSYHYRGQAVDFVPRGGMGALTKEQIRAVVEGAGLTVKELLGPGDKGHGDHFHVAWSGGRFDSRAGKTPGDQEAERIKALGQAIGMNGVGVMAKEEQDAIDELMKAMAKAEEERAQQDAQRKARIEEMMGQGDDEIRLAQMQLAYKGRIGVEEAKILELEEYRLRVKREMPGIEDEELGKLVAQKAAQIDILDVLAKQSAAWQETTRFGENMVDRVLSPDNWHDFGDLGKTVLRELANEMWKLAAINPLKNLLFDSGLPSLFGGGGGGGGLFSGIAKGISGLFGGGAAIGTEYASGGAMWLAENGPELVHLPRGSRVTPAAETRRLLSGANDNRAAITFAPVINAPGADAAALARVETKLEQMRRDLPRTISSTMMDLDQRSHGRWMQGAR